MTILDGSGVSWLETAEGRVDRHAPLAEWPRPGNVWHEGDWLCWTIGNADARPGPGLLEAFVSLHRKDAAAFVRFANRYGVLHVCQHGEPLLSCSERECRRGQFATAGFLSGREVVREPLVAWRRYSRWAWATVRVAAHLNGSRELRLADVALLIARGGDDRLEAAVTRTDHRLGTIAGELPTDGAAYMQKLTEIHQVAMGRGYERVATALEATWRARMACSILQALPMGGANGFLDLGNVKLQLTITRDLKVMPVHLGGGLIGALAMQLALTVAGSKGFAFCSHCGEMYSPHRQPRRDENHYCPECRSTGVPQSLAQKASRERQRRGQPPRHKRGRQQREDSSI